MTVKKLLLILCLPATALSAEYCVSTIDLLPQARVTCNAGGPLLVRCDTLRHRIILAQTLTSSLSLIDGRTHLVENIPLAGRVPQYLKAEAMALNERSGGICLIGHRCFFIIHPDERRSEQILTSRQFESIAVDPLSGNVFLAGRESRHLAFYHAKKKKLTYLPWLQTEVSLANLNATPPPPLRKVVVDPQLRRAVAVDGMQSGLYLFDCDRCRLLQQRPLALEKGGRWHLAGYDRQRHCLYLVIENNNRNVVQTARINVLTGEDAVAAMPGLREGSGILYNSNREEVYVPYDNAACLHVVDFKNPLVEVSLPSFGNDATALDLKRQRLFVASWPQGDVEVVDLVKRRLHKRISHQGLLPHMATLAFNPENGLLYIPKGATAVNGSFGAALMTLHPDAETADKILTGWLPMDLIEWEKGSSFLVFNNEDRMALVDDQGVRSQVVLPKEYPIQTIANAEGDVYLSYGAHQSYWPTVYIWDASNGILTIHRDFSFYDRRLPRQAQKMALDRSGVLHFTQNPWGKEEQFLGNLPDGVRLFDISTRIGLGDQVERETTQRLLQYDALRHRLYLARAAESDSDAGVLQIIDPAEKKVLARVVVGRCPADLCFDAYHLYTADFLSDSVSVVDLEDFTVQTLAVGRGPLKLAVANGAAWVINHLDHSLQRVEAGAAAVAVPAPGRVDQLLVWKDRLIVTAHSALTLTVLAYTPQTAKFETILSYDYPFGDTAFDAGNSSFYMTGQYGDVVYSLNQAKEDAKGRLWMSDFLSGKIFIISER
ncbi:MAG TPA: hypothetical protein PK843_18025 [bacterium]|nr:hypothetical protein [bacterium]